MERKKRDNISRRITQEEWRQHFIGLLQGTEEKKTAPEDREQISEKEKEITLAEMEKQIRKLKKKKAAGEDEVKNEAWLHCTAEVKYRLLGIIQKVWKREGFPKSWRRGVIVPIGVTPVYTPHL